MYSSNAMLIRMLFMGATIIALATVLVGCDPTVRCPAGVYMGFGVDRMHGIRYVPSRDELFVRLTTQVPYKGVECLPQDLSVQNLSACQAHDISFVPPEYVKGRPVMTVWVRNASQVDEDDTIKFDLFQKNKKKQMVRISVAFESASKAVVTVDGERYVAVESR